MEWLKSEEEDSKEKTVLLINNIEDIYILLSNYTEQLVSICSELPTDSKKDLYREYVDRCEKNIIISALNKFNNNIAEVAKFLGISRPTMYDKLKKLGIQITMDVSINY